MSTSRPALWAAAAVLALCPPGQAQSLPGDLVASVEIAPGSGGFGGAVAPGDLFGSALTSLGDLDGDGVVDLAVGAPGDDDGGPQRGAVWILFMAPDGTVAAQQKISALEGGFGGALTSNGAFGHSLAGPGDINGDGVPDLLVGNPRDADGGPKFGAVWVLFLGPDGSVIGEQKISELAGGFTGPLANSDEFGRAVAGLGDLDGDGIPDVAVGALNDDDGPLQSGSLWVLFLQADGTVREQQKISAASGGFGGDLDNNDEFGRSLAALGDLDGNGVTDIAVGALKDDDGGSDTGAVWLLYLETDGSVIAHAKVSAHTPALAGLLTTQDGFGRSVSGPGDVNGDGVPDLLVGAPGQDLGGLDRGAAWLLFLAPDGAVTDARVYGSDPSGALGELPHGAGLGTAVTAAGDVDLNGASDLFVGRADGSSHLLLLAQPFDEPPYQPTAVIDGQAGRSALVPINPDAAGFQDFIDQPAVVVTNTSHDTVNLRVGVGTSGSQEDVPFHDGGAHATGDSPIDVEAGDFVSGSDIEGTLLDLVVANRGGHSVSLLIALPDGDYAPHVESSLLPENGSPVALVSGDFDVDGRLDVAVAGDAGVSVLLGDGFGGFPVMTFTALDLLTDLATADLDGDGDLDLVTTSGRAVTPLLPFEEGGASVLRGAGDGTFTVAGRFTSGTALASVLLGDVDQDGRVDALLAGHAYAAGPAGEPLGTIELFVGDGAGGFAPSTDFAGHASPSAQGIHPTLGALGDLDGDGWLDAVYTSNDSIAYPPEEFGDEQPPVELTVLRGDAAGGFEVATVGTAYTGKGVAPILADIFADPGGLPDAILVWYEDAAAGLAGPGDDDPATYVTALTSDGSAGFFDPSASQFSVGDEPTHGRIADLDTGGSGRPDIVVPNLGDNSLSLLLGDGAGGVRSTLTLTDVGPYTIDDLPPGEWVGGPRAAEVADLDGDGLLDVVVYSAWTDLAPVAPHPGAFASLSVVRYADGEVIQQLPLPRGGEFVLVDATGDGRADVVVSQRLGPGSFEGLLLYAGLPDGTFADPPSTLPLPAGYVLTGGMTAGDLTGDGVADVLTTAQQWASDEGVLVALDLAGPQPIVQLSSVDSAWGAIHAVALGELDGKAGWDVAIGAVDGRLRLAGGLGGLGFAAAPLDPVAAAAGGGALAVGDVDGDGRDDLVTSTAVDEGAVDQASVRILFGQGAGSFQVQGINALQSTGVIGPLRPLLGDLNGDEAPDLVLVHGTSDRISILLNQLSQFAAYGAGKPGSAGQTPKLSGLGFTSLGSTFSVQLQGALGGASGLMLVGTGQQLASFVAVETVLWQLPLAVGGSSGVPGAGTATLSFTVPQWPALVGLEVTFQALLLDPGAGLPAPVQVAASNGLAATVVP